MVILGLEKPVEYGSRQIFDPTMANMVLNAQNRYVQAMREDYMQGREDLKEFNKNFGDFFSPIQKDMEWYDQNVTGATRDLINNLYAQGIDPLRSAEGRAAISRWINNMPTGKINQLKQSAADANEYLKNKAALQSKGLWNPEFERMILKGRSLEDWDTANDGMWTRTAPAEYQDLNKFTTHIFDALKDSYIGTDKDHYDWYGITPEQMMQSLTPDTIGGLLNSDLGRFHYNNAKNDLLRQGVVNPTDAQIMQQFKNNIVAANNEKTHRDRRINELWKMQQENASRMRAARVAAGGDNNNQKDTIVGFTDRVKYAIKQQQNSGKPGTINPRYRIRTKSVKMSEPMLQNWAQKTVTPEGFDQQAGAKLLFYGYTDRSQESMDAISGRKQVRFTFVPNSGLHFTNLRIYDHNGMSVSGSSKSFDDYLHKHHVYGYPIDEPVSITHDTQGNSNIYDANGFMQIEKDQIEGYFKERYQAYEARAKRNGQKAYEYEDYKMNQMRQLGIVENAPVVSKQYVEADGKGVYQPTIQTYYTIPVSRIARIDGLGQSAIDTRVDKEIVSGNELGNRERSYQVRDYNRKSR